MKKLVVAVPGSLMTALRQRAAQEERAAKYRKSVTVSDVVRRLLGAALAAGKREAA